MLSASHSRDTFRRTVVTCLTALSVACGGDETSPSAADVASVAMVFPGTTLSLAATQPLNPLFSDRFGNPIGHIAGATWVSSNSAIASVDQSGNVRGVSLGGPVTVTVAVGSKSANVSFSVVPDHIALTPVVSIMTPNQTIQLFGTAVDYFNAPIPGLSAPPTWMSSNPAVATVGAATGLVTAVAVGDALISATVAGRTSGAHIEVGLPGVYDGTWVGTGNCASCAPATNYTMTFVVVFGRIVSFRMVVSDASPLVVTQICPTGLYGSVMVGASPNAFISNGQFSFSMPAPAATFTGTFATNGTMTGNNTAFLAGILACASNGLGVGALSVAAASFSVTRQ